MTGETGREGRGAMCNWHVPVCVECKVDMKIEKNGVPFIEGSDDGTHRRIWDTDRWGCPSCERTVLVGFGKMAYANNFDKNFDEAVEKVLRLPYTVVERDRRERR